MLRPFRPAVLAALLVGGSGLGACLPPATQDQLGHAVRKDWQRFKATSWIDVGRQVTGLEKIPLTERQQAVADTRKACARQTERRQITQTGIYDAVDYDRCPASRNQPALGQRLAPRDM